MDKKSFYCLFILQLISSLLFAQQPNFKVAVLVKGCNSGKLEIRYFYNKENKKTTFKLAPGGKVVLTGRLDNPEFVYCVLNDSLYTEDFFIAPGKQTLILDASSRSKFAESVATGGAAINAEYRNNYVKRLQPFYDTLDSWYERSDSLKAKFQNNLPDSILSELNSSFLTITHRLDSVKRDYFFRNNSSPISLWKLYELTWFAQNLDLVQEVFEHLDSKLIATPVGRQIKKRLVASKPLLTGNIFPALLLRDSSGNQINLRRKIAAKFTLIDFWFTNCHPCLGQFPDMKRIYEKFRINGFDIIGITTDKKDKMKTWSRLLQEKNLNWQQYWDLNGVEATKLYIDSFPTNILLDADGKIMERNITLEALEELLRLRLSTEKNISLLGPSK